MPSLVLIGPDSRRLIAAGDEGAVFLIDADGKATPAQDVHRGPVNALALGGDGSNFYSAGQDGTLRRWGADSGRALDPLLKAGGSINAVAVGRSIVATATTKGALQWWQATDGKLLAETNGHDGAVTALQIRGDDKGLMSAGSDALLRLWTADGRPDGDPVKHDAGITVAAWSPEFKRIASGTSGGLVRVIGTDGRLTWGNPSEQRGQITALAWSPTGRALATGSSSGEIVLWDAASGRLAGGPAKHDGPVTALAFAPDGKTLASASEDGTVRQWSSDSLKTAADPIKLPAKVLDLAFAPDGKTLVTRSSDNRAGRFRLPAGDAVFAPVVLERAGAPAPAPVPLDPRTFVRVGTDRLVTVGGITGLFTPLGGDPGKPLAGDERANLLSLIDALKRELAGSQTKVQQLQADLATLRERAAPAADFATGVQQSLDEMQQRLSSMRNPVSNFAVRELKLEAGVTVQLTPTGSVEYRFIQPGEELPANAASKLSLQLVPLPKESSAGVWTPGLFTPERPLSDLPELGADQLRLLEGQGMFSIGEFVQVATRVRAQAYLVALLGVDRQRLALWAQQAALMTVVGVNGHVATTLIAAGLGSFEVLASTRPADVLARYEAARRTQPAGNAAPSITAATAEIWVRAARQFLGLPTLDDELPPTPSPSP